MYKKWKVERKKKFVFSFSNFIFNFIWRFCPFVFRCISFSFSFATRTDTAKAFFSSNICIEWHLLVCNAHTKHALLTLFRSFASYKMKSNAPLRCKLHLMHCYLHAFFYTFSSHHNNFDFFFHVFVVVVYDATASQMTALQRKRNEKQIAFTFSTLPFGWFCATYFMLRQSCNLTGNLTLTFSMQKRKEKKIKDILETKKKKVFGGWWALYGDSLGKILFHWENIQWNEHKKKDRKCNRNKKICSVKKIVWNYRLKSILFIYAAYFAIHSVYPWVS